MSVSDLTGTRWKFNDIISTSDMPNSNNYAYIRFSLYKYPYKEWLGGTLNSIKNYPGLYYTGSGAGQNTQVYNGGWYQEYYRYIYIIGGEYATNIDFINWLESNATQQFDFEEYLTNTYDLAQVANAIRGITGNYILLSYPTDMVNTLTSMGMVYNIDQICAKSFTNIIGNTASSIPWYLFMSCISLITASFLSCQRIGVGAFQSCNHLVSCFFPSCSNIESSAFRGCISLTTISFPECTTIGSYAFNGCTSLTSITFPKCSYIGSNAFTGCSSLTTISFPECTTIGSYAFASNSQLSTLSFSKCNLISGNAFQNCSILSSIYFPACTSINIYAFQSCSALTTINFPQTTFISGYAFQSCIQLSEVVLPKIANFSWQAIFGSCYNLISFNLASVSAVPSLQYSNIFLSTPIAGYSASAGQYGSIYVPASLYDAFKSATNWTYFSSRMVSV